MSGSNDVTDESSLATALGSAAFPAVRLAGEAGSDVGDAQKVTKSQSKTQKLSTKKLDQKLTEEDSHFLSLVLPHRESVFRPVSIACTKINGGNVSTRSRSIVGNMSAPR